MWCCSNEALSEQYDIKITSFKDKVVLVTGASSGIGSAIAVQAAKDGADVVLVGRNEAKLTRTSSECEKNGQKPLLIIADVSSDEGVKKIVDITIKTFGKLDVLVNNAGFGKYSSILSEDALENFESIMSTNVRGVVNLTHLAVPHLIRSKGNIVNISSTASQMCLPNLWSYCTSKAALDHFSRCIAAELAPYGVRVNVVNPGPVKTDFFSNMGVTKDMMKATEDKAKEMTPLGRMSDSQEIADVVMFLADDKAKGITGSCYVTDNGALLK